MAAAVGRVTQRAARPGARPRNMCRLNFDLWTLLDFLHQQRPAAGGTSCALCLKPGWVHSGSWSSERFFSPWFAALAPSVGQMLLPQAGVKVEVSFLAQPVHRNTFIIPTCSSTKHIISNLQSKFAFTEEVSFIFI